jgi:hypothetical protein
MIERNEGMIEAIEDHISELTDLLYKYKCGLITIGEVTRHRDIGPSTFTNIFGDEMVCEPILKLQITVEYVNEKGIK